MRVGIPGNGATPYVPAKLHDATRLEQAGYAEWPQLPSLANGDEAHQDKKELLKLDASQPPREG